MKPIKKTNHLIEFSLLGLLAILWGSSYFLLKVAVSEIPPLTLIAVRAAVAALFLLAILVHRKESLPRDIKTWKQLLVQAFFNAIGAWTILAWGQQYVDSGLASVLNSTSPIFVFLYTFLFTRHESTNSLKFFGACLGLLGVVLIIGVDVLAGLGQQVAGQMAALAGAMLYGYAAIYGKRFSNLTSTVTATGTMIWSAIVLVPASLLIEQPWNLNPSINAISAALALGIFSTAFALLIYFRLIKTLGSMGVASQAYLRVAIAVALGVIFLDEQITVVVGIGLLTAIAGVALINLPLRHNASK